MGNFLKHLSPHAGTRTIAGEPLPYFMRIPCTSNWNRWMAAWLGVAFAALLHAKEPAGTPAMVAAPPEPLYQLAPGSPDGVGKWFMGREIAHFMSHQGAMWLERPEREEEEQPTQLLEALKLKPGNVVADIGAGSGYLTWRMARIIGPQGKVYANDIQPEMLAILKTNVLAHGVSNVVAIQGSVTNPNLPTNAVDLAIFVDVYHECDHPYEIIQGVVRSLKPGGRLVFVEYRAEDPDVPIKPLHKMLEAQVKKEMTLHPLDWVQTVGGLPRQHVIIFRKRAGPNPAY